MTPHPYPSPPKKMGAVVDNYKVQVVEDCELPAGTTWLIVQEEERGRSRLLVTRSQFDSPARMCAVLEAAWSASRALLPPRLPWWQRRATLVAAATVAATVAVAVPSPLAVLYGM